MVQVIAAEGERDASESLKEAAKVIQRSPQALQVLNTHFDLLILLIHRYLQYFVQLRYLQTLNSISVEQSSTIIFPFPISITGNDLGLKERTD